MENETNVPNETVTKYKDSKNYYSNKKNNIVEAEKKYYMIETGRAFPGRSHTVSTLTRRSVEMIYPRLRARFMAGGKIDIGAEFHGDQANQHLEELIEGFLRNKINIEMDAYNDIRDFIKQGVRSGTTMCQLWWNKKKQRPEVDTIDIFDIYPEPRCKDIKEVKDGNCWMIIEEVTTLSDIKDKIDAGIYEDQMKELTDSATDSFQRGESSGRDEVDAARLIPTETAGVLDELEKKMYGADKDGFVRILHEVKGLDVKTVTMNGRICLRETKFKKFPFYSWKFYPSPFDFFGEGVGELIRYIQDEATLIRNQRRDMQNLNISGMYSWREGSQIDFYSLQNPRPGGLVRVSDHDDIKAIDPPGFQMMDRALNDEAVLNTEADSLLNISDFQRGQKTNSSLTKTASGIQMILQQSGVKIGEAEDDLGRVLSDLAQDILLMYKERMKVPEVVRLAGREGIKWDRITKEDISEHIKVTVRMDADLGDDEMKLQRYIQLLNILQGYQNIADIRPVLIEVLKLHDFPNPEKIIPTSQEVVMDPETENMLIQRGYPVEVSQQDDHNQHIMVHQQMGEIAEGHIMDHEDALVEGGATSQPGQSTNAQIGAQQPQNPGEVIAGNMGQMGGY